MNRSLPGKEFQTEEKTTISKVTAQGTVQRRGWKMGLGEVVWR